MWRYQTPNSKVLIGGEQYDCDEDGFLVGDVPPHVHTACEISPHFWWEERIARVESKPVVVQRRKKGETHDLHD